VIHDVSTCNPRRSGETVVYRGEIDAETITQLIREAVDEFLAKRNEEVNHNEALFSNGGCISRCADR
jgi:hypothetical protein